jgi:hypothetical protein
MEFERLQNKAPLWRSRGLQQDLMAAVRMDRFENALEDFRCRVETSVLLLFSAALQRKGYS